MVCGFQLRVFFLELLVEAAPAQVPVLRSAKERRATAWHPKFPCGAYLARDLAVGEERCGLKEPRLLREV